MGHHINVSALDIAAVREQNPMSLGNKMDVTATRVLDITLSIVVVIFLLPLLAIIAVLVYAFDPGPIFFAQRRIGRDGRTFNCLKFRTMAIDAQQRLDDLLANDPEARAEWARDHKLRKDPRIVGIGHFLRKSSLDELPQLINVLRGEMSLVGPRPIVAAEVVRYGRYFQDYCRVRPGITGLWQIGGRNDVSYRRRVAMDVKYCRSQSFGINIRILALTIPMVALSKGSY